MDSDSIASMIEQYTKHDWMLRRVLSSGSQVIELPNDHSAIQQRKTGLDALWFSRRSRPDAETWELRRLIGSPFALVAILPDDADEEEREEILAAVEVRMKESG